MQHNFLLYKILSTLTFIIIQLGSFYNRKQLIETNKRDIKENPMVTNILTSKKDEWKDIRGIS